LAFAGRIAWEKTIWTWSRGPQMVGFSLMHIHPGFFVAGLLCCGLLILWLIPALFFLIIRRQNILHFDDLVMVFFDLRRSCPDRSGHIFCHFKVAIYVAQKKWVLPT
jgi:hypothetical protein